MLNPKQKRFCEEYILDLNATQAYIRAGYSKNGSAVSASKLLTNTNICEYITLLQVETQERTKVTLDEVVARINNIGINGEENNKLKANDMLMKHLGGYTADKTDTVQEAIVIDE